MKTDRKITQTAANWFQNPTFWLINLGVILVCFYSGPFGTLDALPGGFRLIYWGAIVLTTSTLAIWMHAVIQSQSWKAFFNIAVIGVSFGVLVSAIVILISLSLLSPIGRYPGHVQLVLYSFPTATVIFMISVFLVRALKDAPEHRVNKQPDLLNRLEKVADAKTILWLSAQDHYVEVKTELGSELCLIRLADAIAETSPIDGFQIHRSHWVSKEAVKHFDKHGGVAQVTLTDGTTLKVSQSRVAEFKKYFSKNAI